MSSKMRIALIAPVATALLAAGATAFAAAAAHHTTKRLTDSSLKATVTIPVAWKKIPYLGPGRFGFSGKSGWMQLGASQEPGGLPHACRLAAAGTASIRVFGKHPRITFRKIDGRPGA